MRYCDLKNHFSPFLTALDPALCWWHLLTWEQQMKAQVFDSLPCGWRPARSSRLLAASWSGLLQALGELVSGKIRLAFQTTGGERKIFIYSCEIVISFPTVFSDSQERSQELELSVPWLDSISRKLYWKQSHWDLNQAVSCGRWLSQAVT